MKINFDAPLNDDAGNPALIPGGNGRIFTLGTAACQALLNATGEEKIDGIEKHARYQLWKLIQQGGSIDLQIDDVAKIKRLIGAAFGPLVVGQCWDLLEGAA
ncbi:hypothetical protein [Burkholderia cepacia]|uniref:hypothetical protein n=1 Tax=Burkholderia cepacia TaxID=292 RepID=UPI001F3BDEF8|nr:hypothetical protein [Burkholderia cepacia]UIY60085.1 hypothetical protein LZ568_18790 [Burkholderia cepacia]